MIWGSFSGDIQDVDPFRAAQWCVSVSSVVETTLQNLSAPQLENAVEITTQ